MKKLDVRQILAERNERKKREMELNGFPTDGNDSLPMTPSFSESLPSSTTCHGDILKISVELTNIFRLFPRQAGLLEFTDSQFSKDSILIESSSQGYSSQSNTEKKLNNARVKDVPKMSHADLKNYLQSEILVPFTKSNLVMLVFH
ncbi:hypothetical protein OUZ56_013158 [Daphnia magna]|uniref:Uncharacterized protein n=1 Tax=Daphnia magna TaxID=35525 RepID=A0ABQ9Z518_9CRUS|nr:hypothetical protein OUZ56_013158 [Daphnia magna]